MRCKIVRQDLAARAMRLCCEAGSGGVVHVKEQNTQAKKANLSEGRGAKPQVQNGWLGCRLERDGDQVLFGGESLKSTFVLRTQPGDKCSW